MNIKQAFLLAIKNIKANKLRSILTMLGIIVGVSSVITMSIIMDSFKATLTGTITEMSNQLYINGDLKRSDLERVMEDYQGYFKDVKLSESNSSYGIITDKHRYVNSEITGIDTNFFELNSYYSLIDGRKINYIDQKNGNKVAILTDNLAYELFALENPIGKTIYVLNQKYKVIGVAKYDYGIYDNEFKAVLVPSNSINLGYSVFYMNFSNKELMSPAQKVLETNLKNKNIWVYNSNENNEGLDETFAILNGIKYILMAIAGISLFVGGIGIMNIMLVTVTERVKEIGIRKSLGAHPREILTQFIIESSTISLVGGLIGLGLGFGFAFAIIAVVSYLIKIKLIIVFPISTIIIALTVSIAIGIIFGFIPARKASKLDPIDSLRYE